MRAAIARGDGVVAGDLRAGGGEVRNRLAVGPIGHRTCEQPAHRRLVMAGEVIVGRAGGNRAGAGQGERRERARMVERGHLGDHPADADPREVRRLGMTPPALIDTSGNPAKRSTRLQSMIHPCDRA
jgi:hypothetical protein